MSKNILAILGPLLGITLLASCEGIDCTVDNVVTLGIGFYDAESGSAKTISDTLTVTANGTDSILYNQGSRISSIKLPLSYWQEADTLNLTFYDAENDASHVVTLCVKKTNTPHHESPDCPTTMFHEIKEIAFTSATQYVDSITLTDPKVNYASQENIKIYLHPTSD